MGAGKTTVGRELARNARGAGVSFVDVDERIVQTTGKDIPTLFAELGERGFRAIEERAALECLHDTQYAVIALGGGAVTSRRLRHAVLERGYLVTLDGTPQTLAARIQGSARPLLAVGDPQAVLESIAAARSDAYAECHLRVDTTNLSPTQIAHRIELEARRETLVMPLGQRSYVIEFTKNDPARVREVLLALRPSGVILVTDENVRASQGAYIDAVLQDLGAPACTLQIRPGEVHKTLETVSQIWDVALGFELDRDAVVLAIGGGVASDMAGFAAATLLRGLRWMSIRCRCWHRKG